MNLRPHTWVTNKKRIKVPDILLSIKHRVETGLIRKHPMAEAQKYFPQTPPFVHREIKKFELKEDKIRDEYYAMFPHELKKSLKLFPTAGMWYDDPADLWVFKQSELMKENDLTFQQGWDIMMYNYRKDLHRERLAKQYQLQQLQEEGVQMVPEVDEMTKDDLQQTRNVYDLLEQEKAEEGQSVIWSGILFRLAKKGDIKDVNPADLTRPISDASSIRKSDYPDGIDQIRFNDHDGPYMSQTEVLEFLMKYPNLSFVFHNEWFNDSKRLNELFPRTEKQEIQLELWYERNSGVEEDEIEPDEDNPKYRQYMRDILAEESKVRDSLAVVNYPVPFVQFLEEKGDANEPINNNDVADIFSSLGFTNLKRMLEIDEVEKEKALADLTSIEEEFDSIINSAGPKIE